MAETASKGKYMGLCNRSACLAPGATSDEVRANAGNSSADIVSRLESYGFHSDEWPMANCDDWGKLKALLTQKEAEIERLNKLVHVPGLWHCAKCEFQLMQRNLNAQDGTVTARDQPGDKCPNCNSPLWRVTERQAGNDMCDRAEAEILRCRDLESRLSAAESEVARLRLRPGGAEGEAMMPDDPHPVVGSNGVPVYRGHLFWRKHIGWKCKLCEGTGRVNHRCLMVCVDDPCPRCGATGVLKP